MFTEERHKYILDLLDRNGKIFVKDLSKEFKVSESMIRKDLKVLEKKNLLRRTYGGAINIDNTSINIKSFMIAKLIVENNKQLTIITNMFEIASLITPNIITKFIFIGGDYNSYVGGSIGSHAIEQINNYRCNKAFLGCTGIDLRDGTISTSLSEDAATKKAITNISDKLFLVTLNEKFKKNGSFKFSNLFDFYGIITEQLPDESITLNLKEYYINII